MSQALKRGLIIGLVAYALFLLATLPARFMSSSLQRHGIRTGELSGSLWHGQAEQLQVGVLNVGKVEWHWRFLPLLLGRLAADVDIKQPAGQLQGRIALGINGKLMLSDLQGALPLQALVGSNGLPGGWTAQAELNLDELVLKDQWPAQAKGQITLRDFTGPASAPANLGSFQLTFADQTGKDQLVALLKDLPNSALGLEGTLTFNANRSYVLDAKAHTTASSPKNFANALPILGPADAAGNYPLTISGTF